MTRSTLNQMDDSCMIANSSSDSSSNVAGSGSGDELKCKRTATAVAPLTLFVFLCLLMLDQSQAATAKDGHGGGGGSHSGGGDSRSSSTGQHSTHQSVPNDSSSIGGRGGDNDESNNAEDAFSTMMDDIVGQIYLVIVGIVLGTWIMYMICTCRTKRIQKEAFHQKVELMKQEVVLDCEIQNINSHNNNNNHNNNNDTYVADMIDTIGPFDAGGSSSSSSFKQPWSQSSPVVVVPPMNGRYESTYMKPWETCKSHVYLTYTTRHDGGKGWLIGGTGMDNEGSFSIIEGLLSESGKSYWVEKYDETTGPSLSCLSVTSGTFHLPSMRDCSNTCFNGSWHANNGTRGIYWSFRLANSDNDKDKVFSDIDLQHVD